MKKISLTLLTVVAFCNILSAQSTSDNMLSTKEKKQGWKLLFDGSTTTGWTSADGKPTVAAPGAWEIDNGTLILKKDAKGGDIFTVDEFSDFELSADFNLVAGTNSGIKYLFTKYAKGGNLGCEFQIIDDVNGEDNKLADHLLGSLYDVLPPVEAKKKVNPPGQWNTIRVIAKGMNVQHFVNGVKVLEYNRDSKVYADGVADSKFSKVEPMFGTVEKGKIMLQDHHGPIAFKNLKIRPL